MTPGYCSQCKQTLTVSQISDDNTAWCPDCKDYVVTACFEVPSWVMGATWLVICVVCLRPF